MFNLEQSISNWRRQMLAAGITNPALDELESHLREEIESLTKSGMSEEQAFKATVSQIGPAKELKAEFAKNGLLSIWICRILGPLWLVQCLVGFVAQWRVVIHFPLRNISEGMQLLPAILFTVLYGIGIVGSILLFCGATMGRKIIRLIAVAFLLMLPALIALSRLQLHAHLIVVAAIIAFYLITVWLLYLPSHRNLDGAGKHQSP